MIGLIAATAAGTAAGERLAAAWPGETRAYPTARGSGMDTGSGVGTGSAASTGPGTVRDALTGAFAECDAIVCFLATGAVVRLIAPLLADKTTDPGIVCVDEAQQHAVALLGGHSGGANELAERVADTLGCRPVITTATDATGLPGLDMLGLPVEGAIATVSRAILDGTPVRLDAQGTHPLPALPTNVQATTDSHGFHASFTLRISDRQTETDERTAVLRPPTLVIGVGASRGVASDEVLTLIRDTLTDHGLSPLSVSHLATVDAKADEPGLIEAARALGVPLVTHPATALAAVQVPNPSSAPLAAVGTPSVCEAAALIESGAELLVPKRKSRPGNGQSGESGQGERSGPGRQSGQGRKRRPAMCTVAVARRRPRGRLAVVGLGPGARDLLTPRARAELRRASVIVGLDQYVDQIRDLLRPGTRVLESGLGAEEERARRAVGEARAGHAVALIGSGDAGVYAMASPALAEAGDDIDVVGVPGVTAALAAGAVLGAPLGHDHVAISLSDLHTPWEVIERRVRAAAESDLVVTFYNPRSRGRDWQLPKALAVIAEHRAPSTTPVGVVHAASRPDQWHTVTTLAELDPATVDMVTVVVVGNSATRTFAGRMVTPRGYRWQR